MTNLTGSGGDKNARCGCRILSKAWNYSMKFESVACSLLLYPRSLKQVFGFGAWLGPTILPIDTRVHTKYIPQDASCCLVLCKPITHESQNIYCIYILQYIIIIWYKGSKLQEILCFLFFPACLTIWHSIFRIFPHQRQVSGKTKPRLVVRSVQSCRLFAQCLPNVCTMISFFGARQLL